MGNVSTKHKVLTIFGVAVYVLAMSALGRLLRGVGEDYPEAIIPYPPDDWEIAAEAP